MVSVFSPVRDMTAEEFRRVTEVTYLGVVRGTLAALRRMPYPHGSMGPSSVVSPS
jgi:NAD(P)-dependent dehydrogenase (short-subunit alcohol dehydrogenase family)